MVKKEDFGNVVLTRMSKHLAFLLRHDESGFNSGLIDCNGWRSVDELCSGHGFSVEMIKKIVALDNKGRYELSSDGLFVRARQGHSIPVDVELSECIPPTVLYHGTSLYAYENHIKDDGLKPMSRLYVHVSGDIETAEKVGLRHSGNIVVIVIDTVSMVNDGFKFYLSRNGVWLTRMVPSKYFKEVKK